MVFGLRALLLIVALVLFVVATGVDNEGDYIAWGLACTAAALLVQELGLNIRIPGGRRR